TARVPILLPQSVYPVQNRDVLLAQTGGELYGYLPLAEMGALEYRAYAGTIFLEVTTPSSGPFTIEGLGVPYLVGGRLMWETPVQGLRLGGSVQGLELNAKLGFGATDVMVKLPVVLWVASAEYVVGDFLA